MMTSSRSQRSKPVRSPCCARYAAAALLLCAAPVLAGCSGSLIADHMPAAVGGLAEDAPARPATPPDFPAVHNMPPPRATATLNDDQQKLLESDLISVRNRVGANPEPSPAAGNSSTGTSKNP